ncbi:phage tail tape measure protein [Paenibacillus sp. SC116]|uniref:phage tail tape measure protein n=1 Tax=Paenibacillus sp. SC116 TaxID=2968986 RepID=UPI00215AB21A|nr:phage tail tape measure protein [Paenibacillus sp. SC116]MCR8844210.1 phage tail tape measure protein [Paenibacillus sp. SC116]
MDVNIQRQNTRELQGVSKRLDTLNQVGVSLIKKMEAQIEQFSKLETALAKAAKSSGSTSVQGNSNNGKQGQPAASSTSSVSSASSSGSDSKPDKELSFQSQTGSTNMLSKSFQDTHTSRSLDEIIKVKFDNGNDKLVEELSKLRDAETRRLGVSADVLHRAQYMLLESKRSPDDIKQMLPALNNMAVANQVDLMEATRVGDRVSSSYGIPADQMNRLSDIMTFTKERSNMSLQDLGGQLESIAPEATKAGVQIEELASAIHVLNGQKIGNSSSISALNSIMSEMRNPTSDKTKKLSENGGSNDVTNALDQLSQQLSGQGLAKQKETVSSMFPKADAEAILALVNNRSKISDFEKQYYATGGNLAQNQVAPLSEGSVGAMNELKSQAAQAQDNIVNATAPIMNALYKIASGLVNFFNHMPGYAQAIIAFGAAAVAGTVGIAALSSSFKEVRTLFTNLKSRFGKKEDQGAQENEDKDKNETKKDCSCCCCKDGNKQSSGSSTDDRKQDGRDTKEKDNNDNKTDKNERSNKNKTTRKTRGNGTKESRRKKNRDKKNARKGENKGKNASSAQNDSSNNNINDIANSKPNVDPSLAEATGDSANKSPAGKMKGKAAIIAGAVGFVGGSTVSNMITSAIDENPEAAAAVETAATAATVAGAIQTVHNATTQATQTAATQAAQTASTASVQAKAAADTASTAKKASWGKSFVNGARAVSKATRFLRFTPAGFLGGLALDAGLWAADKWLFGGDKEEKKPEPPKQPAEPIQTAVTAASSTTTTSFKPNSEIVQAGAVAVPVATLAATAVPPTAAVAGTPIPTTVPTVPAPIGAGGGTMDINTSSNVVMNLNVTGYVDQKMIEEIKRIAKEQYDASFRSFERHILDKMPKPKPPAPPIQGKGGAMSY